MKTRVIAAAVGAAAAVASLSALTSTPANASSYTGKDPYTTGCANTGRQIDSQPMKNDLGDAVGTIYLYWSSGCQTNWTEIRVSSVGYGTITVYADGKTPVSYNYKAGNGGHHWGNMIVAPGICAWGSATVTTGSGRLNHGTGWTPKHCG